MSKITSITTRALVAIAAVFLLVGALASPGGAAEYIVPQEASDVCQDRGTAIGGWVTHSGNAITSPPGFTGLYDDSATTVGGGIKFNPLHKITSAQKYHVVFCQ